MWSDARGRQVIHAITCSASLTNSAFFLQAVAVKVLKAPLDDPAKQSKLQKAGPIASMMLGVVTYTVPLYPEDSSRALRLAAVETQKYPRTIWHYIELWALSRIRVPLAREREHQQILEKAER